MRNLVIFVFIPLLVTPLLIILGLSLFQERFLFYPSPLSADFKFSLEHPFREIEVAVQGENIHSLLVSAKNPPAKKQMQDTLILYFHGNAGSLESWAYVAGELAERTGASVWMMDYPGFGKSEGRLQSSEQVNAMAEAFAAQIPKLGTFKNLVIYGRSIGTGPAAALAGKLGNFVGGVILETPFLSLAELIHDYAPWFPKFLIRYQFDNVAALKNYPGPILIFHGRKDEVIPYRHGESLAQALSQRGRVTLVEFEDGTHNDLYRFSNYGEYLESFFMDLGK